MLVANRCIESSPSKSRKAASKRDGFTAASILHDLQRFEFRDAWAAAAHRAPTGQSLADRMGSPHFPSVGEIRSHRTLTSVPIEFAAGEGQGSAIPEFVGDDR
jgi:hypothetical protein